LIFTLNESANLAEQKRNLVRPSNLMLTNIDKKTDQQKIVLTTKLLISFYF